MENEIYPIRKTDKGKATRRIFSQEELELIKNLLSTSDKSMKEIGKILSCDPKVISAINYGERQHQDNWNYPLRSSPLKTGPKNKIS